MPLTVTSTVWVSASSPSSASSVQVTDLTSSTLVPIRASLNSAGLLSLPAMSIRPSAAKLSAFSTALRSTVT